MQCLDSCPPQTIIIPPNTCSECPNYLAYNPTTFTCDECNY